MATGAVFDVILTFVAIFIAHFESRFPACDGMFREAEKNDSISVTPFRLPTIDANMRHCQFRVCVKYSHNYKHCLHENRDRHILPVKIEKSAVNNELKSCICHRLTCALFLQLL